MFPGTITNTGRKLDREKQDEHTLHVIIKDKLDARSALSSKLIVNVQVLDQNDHSPSFLLESYSFTVPFVGPVTTRKQNFWGNEQTRNEVEYVVGQVSSCMNLVEKVRLLKIVIRAGYVVEW